MNEFPWGHNRDALEDFEGEEVLAVAADDGVGMGFQGTGQEHVVGGVVSDAVNDALARLRLADYHAGLLFEGTPTRRYQYAFDRSGNRTQQSLSLNGGTPTVTNYTYNAANQLTSGGATYDSNGNMLSDGTNAYTWDRANRLLSMGGASCVYDGEGRRVKQTVVEARAGRFN
ncbi:MAG: hypothetical protein JNM70_08845 [Anaerolineae bacterium]|nr:hypothetical protein [Anaerolineae bacterium]